MKDQLEKEDENTRKSEDKKREEEDKKKAEKKVNEAEEKEEGSLTTTESKKTGKMDWGLYKYYFRCVGTCLVVVIVILFVLGLVANVAGQFILSI